MEKTKLKGKLLLALVEFAVWVFLDHPSCNFHCIGLSVSLILVMFSHSYPQTIQPEAELSYNNEYYLGKTLVQHNGKLFYKFSPCALATRITVENNEFIAITFISVTVMVMLRQY